MAEENLRQRAKRKLIQVTFPDGKVICYSNVTETFIATLKEIGSERFPEIHLELSKLPILSREIYPKYEKWMKPVCDGWYLFAQSNTDQKYIQLRAISDSLHLGLTIELDENLEPQANPEKGPKCRTKEKLLVKFPDGEYFADNNSLNTFLQCLWKLGIDEIMKKNLNWGANPLITTYKISNRQIQVGENRWVTAPTSTKDRAKLLTVIAGMLRIKLEITKL